MLHFLNPWFLSALAAAGIPLFLHLLQKRRVVRVPFSTLRFLQLAQKRASRRLRLEHFMLWLLRTLLIVLLALAFAMPLLRTRALSQLLAAAPRDLAIVIDRSGSMQYRLGRGMVWDEAVAAAESLIDGLQEGDRVCVFVAEKTPVAVIEKLTADRGLATRSIKSLVPGHGRSDLTACIKAAYQALREQSGAREREVHVISDGQLLPWQGVLGELTAGTPSPQTASLFADDDDRTVCAVTLVGPPSFINAAPLDVRLTPAVLTEGTSPLVTVQVGSSGGAGAPVAVLSVDGEQVVRRALTPEEAESGSISLALPSLAAGVHEAEVRLPPDNLPIDDVFHFLVRVEPSLHCLAVGADEEVFFLRKALQAGRGAAIDAEFAAGGNLGTRDLSEYACVFLATVNGLGGQAISSLDAYVRGGGVLVVFADADGREQDYANLKCLPLVRSAGRAIASGQQRRELHWDAPRHPLLVNLTSGRGAQPVLHLKRLVEWDVSAAGSTVLASAGPEAALLVEHPFGDGRVLCFAVTAGRQWSSLPLSTHFLPLLHECVRYGGGVRRLPVSVTVASSHELPRDVRVPSYIDALLGPGDRRAPLRRLREGARSSLWVDGVAVPGVYRLKGRGVPDAPVLAVNADRSESDLTRLEPGSLPDITGSGNFHVAVGREEMERATRSFRVGQTFGEHLLWAVLLLGLVEVTLANRLARRHLPLSAALKVEATGRVRKGASP